MTIISSSEGTGHPHGCNFFVLGQVRYTTNRQNTSVHVWNVSSEWTPFRNILRPLHCCLQTCRLFTLNNMNCFVILDDIIMLIHILLSNTRQVFFSFSLQASSNSKSMINVRARTVTITSVRITYVNVYIYICCCCCCCCFTFPKISLNSPFSVHVNKI